MEEIILVGMADLNICCSPDSITTVALGSCVGIVLYDPLLKVAGLAHIMLPDSTQITRNQNKAKFADTAIDTLIKLMEVEDSIRKSRLVSKIAGGAQMFNFKTQNDTLRVGERNVIATKDNLKLHDIPIIAEDIGENYGRTIVFYPETGELDIKAVGKPIKTI